jgi:hypothetical protein
MIDGVTYELSPEEEALTRQFWALNQTYPDYIGHIGWDGVNQPNTDMDGAKKTHTNYHSSSYSKALEGLRHKIEVAEENGQDTSALIAERKHLRTLEKVDTSTAQNFDDLRALVPAELKPFWPFPLS